MQKNKLATVATALVSLAATIPTQAGHSYIMLPEVPAALELYAPSPANPAARYNMMSSEIGDSIISDILITPAMKVISELSSYSNLSDDWDGYGYGAVAADADTVKACITLLRQIEELNYPLPKPMLASSGEVSLYWELDENYIEIGFDSPEEFSYLISNSKGAIGQDDCKLSGGLTAQLVIALKE